ncbi:unnamed protein product, partial [Mesorhabditis spiculigera]
MVRHLLLVIFLVQVALATAGGSNADQCDTNQCKQLDGGGIMYECFCSNCDNTTNTCTATTKTLHPADGQDDLERLPKHVLNWTARKMGSEKGT